MNKAAEAISFAWCLDVTKMVRDRSLLQKNFRCAPVRLLAVKRPINMQIKRLLGSVAFNEDSSLLLPTPLVQWGRR